jgi:MFS family permease
VTYPALLALGALDAAGYSIIAPVVPEIAAETSAAPAVIGALIATFPAGMVIGFALAGIGVRRDRTRLVIGTGLVLIVAGSGGFVLGDSLAAFFLARSVMGLGSGCVWIGITFATLARWPGQEYVCMSRIFAAYSIGGLIGPALGAIDGIDGPFLAYGLLAAGAVALIPAIGRRGRFAGDRGALRAPGFRAASAAIVFTVLALGVVEGVLPLHLARHLEQTEIGLIYAAVAVLVAGSAAIAARFAPRVDVLAAALMITAGLALAGATQAVPLWIAALVLTGAGVGLGNTGSIGMLLEAVSPERIVTAMIVWSQLGIAGYLLGPIAAGVVADSLGFAALGLVPLGALALLLPALRGLGASPSEEEDDAPPIQLLSG